MDKWSGRSLESASGICKHYRRSGYLPVAGTPGVSLNLAAIGNIDTSHLQNLDIEQLRGIADSIREVRDGNVISGLDNLQSRARTGVGSVINYWGGYLFSR